ncbi:MAG: energy-coupling factor transporter transmembrane component T family protein [Candidatus Njordarchaeales archaeon]
MSYEIDLSFLTELFPIIPPATREIISAIMIFVILLTFFPALIAYLVFKIIGLSGFRRLFSYERRSSLAHRMHPLSKIMFVLFISIGVAMVEEFWSLLILTLLSISMWSISNPSEDKMRLLTILLLTQWLLVAWAQSFLNPGFTRGIGLTAIYRFPKPLRIVFNLNYITLEGFYYGVSQGLRLVAALSAAVWLITTTHPSEIVYGLRVFRFPVEINFMIAVAFRSIPTILEKSSLVLAAEIARGLRIFPEPSTNIIKVIRELFRSFYVVIMAFIPVIIESLRAGRQLALAATTKAFRAYKERTYFRKIPFTTFDIIYTIVFTIGLILIIIIPFLNYYLGFPITL